MFISSITALDTQIDTVPIATEIYYIIGLRSLQSTTQSKKNNLFSKLQVLMHDYPVNKHNKYGNSPLCDAVYHADIEIVTYLLSLPQILVDNGNIDRGTTPLMATVLALDSNQYVRSGKHSEAFVGNMYAVAALLINHGANLYQTDNLGRTVFDLAKKFHFYDYKKYLSTLKKKCPICCDKLVSHDATWLPCAHQFHETCIQKWENSDCFTNDCPICRTPMYEDNW